MKNIINVLITATFLVMLNTWVGVSISTKRIISAVEDSGSSCHPQRIIKKGDIEVKDTYIEWSE